MYSSTASGTDPGSKNEADSGLFLGIFFTIMTIIAAGAVCCLYQRIVVAIVLIKEGSKAVASSYSTVFFPIIPLIFQIGIFAMFASVAVNIQFIGSRDDTGIQAALHVRTH